jgi:hypothetical protein
LIYVSYYLRFLLEFGYNQPYPYGINQGMPYGGPGMPSGIPYNGQGNYPGYYPGGAGNVWIPPNNNIIGLPRSRVVNPRTSGNIDGSNLIQRSNYPPLPPNNPINMNIQ